MQLTVVLIDDDTDDLMLMKEAIREVNPRTNFISFTHPEKAIEVLAKDLVILPDYVFIDYNMPCKTGQECLRELRDLESYREVPIIMYSTTMIPSVRLSLKMDGATHTFQKPVLSADYKDMITYIFSKQVSAAR